MKTTPERLIMSTGIGTGAYIVGALVLLLGLVLFFYNAFVAGTVLGIPGLILVGFRVRIVLDKRTLILTRKTGLFFAFIPRYKKSYAGITAVVLRRHPSHFNFTSNVKAQSSYSLELEHPEGNIPVDYFDSHSLGYKTGHDIAKWLEVRFYQNIAQ